MMVTSHSRTRDSLACLLIFLISRGCFPEDIYFLLIKYPYYLSFGLLFGVLLLRCAFWLWNFILDFYSTVYEGVRRLKQNLKGKLQLTNRGSTARLRAVEILLFVSLFLQWTLVRDTEHSVIENMQVILYIAAIFTPSLL